MRTGFFDLATQTGWAIGHAGGVEDYGSFELPRTGEDVGYFLVAAENRINEVLDRFEAITLIAFEAPFIDRKNDTILKVRKLSGLANEVEKAATRRDVRCLEASVDDVRRHFLGREYPRTRKAAKLATKVKCRDLGWDVDNDDQADALAGLSYMIAIEQPEKALEVAPLFQWTPTPRRAA